MACEALFCAATPAQSASRGDVRFAGLAQSVELNRGAPGAVWPWESVEDLKVPREIHHCARGRRQTRPYSLCSPHGGRGVLGGGTPVELRCRHSRHRTLRSVHRCALHGSGEVGGPARVQDRRETVRKEAGSNHAAQHREPTRVTRRTPTTPLRHGRYRCAWRAGRRNDRPGPPLQAPTKSLFSLLPLHASLPRLQRSFYSVSRHLKQSFFGPTPPGNMHVKPPPLSAVTSSASFTFLAVSSSPSTLP